MYYVYVLKSQTTSKRYIGHTSDLERRLAEHNDPLHNKLKHTFRRKGHWVLIHSEELSIRSEAIQRERWLKNGMGREWLNKYILKNAVLLI